MPQVPISGRSLAHRASCIIIGYIYTVNFTALRERDGPSLHILPYCTVPHIRYGTLRREYPLDVPLLSEDRRRFSLRINEEIFVCTPPQWGSFDSYFVIEDSGARASP